MCCRKRREAPGTPLALCCGRRAAGHLGLRQRPGAPTLAAIAAHGVVLKVWLLFVLAPGAGRRGAGHLGGLPGDGRAKRAAAVKRQSDGHDRTDYRSGSSGRRGADRISFFPTDTAAKSTASSAGQLYQSHLSGRTRLRGRAARAGRYRYLAGATPSTRSWPRHRGAAGAAARDARLGVLVRPCCGSPPRGRGRARAPSANREGGLRYRRRRRRLAGRCEAMALISTNRGCGCG